MENSNNDFLKNIITKSTQQKMQIIAAEKRKKCFQDLGRKGGLKKKSNLQLTKIISFRLTDLEYEESQKKSQKYNLKLSAYARMVHLQKELKVREYDTDKILSVRKRISARTSPKRFIRHNLGFKAPRGYGWLTDPKKAIYNRVYKRTTVGCLLILVMITSTLTILACLFFIFL